MANIDPYMIQLLYNLQDIGINHKTTVKQVCIANRTQWFGFFV